MTNYKELRSNASKIIGDVRKVPFLIANTFKNEQDRVNEYNFTKQQVEKSVHWGLNDISNYNVAVQKWANNNIWLINLISKNLNFTIYLLKFMFKFNLIYNWSLSHQGLVLHSLR